LSGIAPGRGWLRGENKKGADSGGVKPTGTGSMAEQVSLLDMIDAVRGGVDAVRQAFEQGQVRLRLYALPRSGLRIRARKRIIRLDEGKLARLEYALISLAVAKKNEGLVFKEFAEKVGDYKAAAAYLSFLWRSGFLGFEDDSKALNLFIAANALSQKTYEHKMAKVVDATFRLNLEKLGRQPSDTVLCVQEGGRVACRYIVANMPRTQAKAFTRALFEAAGYRPA